MSFKQNYFFYIDIFFSSISFSTAFFHTFYYIIRHISEFSFIFYSLTHPFSHFHPLHFVETFIISPKKIFPNTTNVFLVDSFKIISLGINYFLKLISPNLKDPNKLQLFHIGERRRGVYVRLIGYVQ